MRELRRRARTLASAYRMFVKWYGFIPGALHFVRFAGLKAMSRLFRYDALLLYRKDAVRRADAPGAPDELRFQAATGEDLEAIGKMNPSMPADFIRKRLADRETCYVARRDGRGLCAYLWVAPGQRTFQHRSREIVVDEGDVYIRDVLTLPEHRGQGITPRFLSWIDDRTAAEGYRRMWAAIRYSNLPSRRSFTKAGFRLDEKVHFAKLPFLEKEIMFTTRGRER